MRKTFCAIIGLLTFFSLSANAWNSVGHRTIAELAWRELSKKERQAATELLKQHPHYNELLSASVPTGVETNEWVFLTAAVWPDMVRQSKPGQPRRAESITKYDLYPHAIGYPFMRLSESNAALIKDFYIAEPNAEVVLSNSIATLKNRKASAHDRAVSLCWALHLMGDLHQPLHAATWLRIDRTEWDGLGGNYIVLDATGNPSPEKVHLHAFWDQLGGVNPSYQTVAALADKLEGSSEIKASVRRDFRAHRTIPSWVQESFRLAVHFAYAEDRVQFAHIDDLESGKVPESAIPVLKKEYIDGAREIAYRRMLLASQRLTGELKKAW